MKKRVEYIFFDFDGTISDSKILAYNSLINVLDKIDFNVSKIKIKKLMGIKIKEMLKLLGLNNNQLEKIKTEFYNNLVNEKHIKKLKLCKNITPLKDLKKKGIKLIIISNSHHKFLFKSIKTLKLTNFFHEVYGSEDFKTKDQILKKLIKKYKISPENSIYIGDRFTDIICAKKAKLISIAINNECSWSTKTEILEQKPDFIIYDFFDLKTIIQNLNQNSKKISIKS